MVRAMVRAQGFGQDSHCHWGNESTRSLSPKYTLGKARASIGLCKNCWRGKEQIAQSETVLMTYDVCTKMVRNTMQLWILSFDLVWKKKKKKANILEECVECAAWEEKLDTCSSLLDMRSCQCFKGAAPLSTSAVATVNLICVLRCARGCIRVCITMGFPSSFCDLSKRSNGSHRSHITSRPVVSSILAWKYEPWGGIYIYIHQQNWSGCTRTS